MNQAPPSVSILTRPAKLIFEGCFKYYLKKYVRMIMRLKRGPDAVFEGLIRGLKTAKIPFNVDPFPSKLANTVHVLSNPVALAYAINLKKTGRIKRLIAGPNITVLPTEHGKILCSEHIDKILVPSQWTKEAYIMSESSLLPKIETWPVGVEIPQITQTKTKNDLIVFIKKVDEEILSAVLNELKERRLSFKKITYGSFTRKQYMRALQSSRGMIYLQEVESQGLALQEAWSYNIPTLVWNKGFFKYPGTDIKVEGKVSAPYLTDAAGIFFKDKDNLTGKLDIFLNSLKNYSPRDYCVKNLSDEASIKIYAKVL